MTIKLKYEDRQYFHPSPSTKMMAMISAILSKLNWQIEVSVDELTRKEAKELISKGIRVARRKRIYLLEKE